MYKKTDGLGIFDSGVGGLTVVEALKAQLPYEHFYYLADTLNLPYGNKAKEQIEAFSVQNCSFLLQYPLKALIVACHTAAANAYELLKLRFNIPIFDVLTTAVEEAVQRSRNGRIAVLGTEATIHSNTYEKRIKSLNPENKVISIACPLLVPVVEQNLLKYRIAAQIVRQYLHPLKSSEVDTLILGCTHYPFLKELILKEIGRPIEIVDSAAACVSQVKSYLEKMDLLAIETSDISSTFFVSENPRSFARKGKKLLNIKFSAVKKIKPM
jgi:glutamate racemase